jgi:hypothetical protein
VVAYRRPSVTIPMRPVTRSLTRFVSGNVMVFFDKKLREN